MPYAEACRHRGIGKGLHVHSGLVVCPQGRKSLPLGGVLRNEAVSAGAGALPGLL